jgi:hypothetical protein
MAAFVGQRAGSTGSENQSFGALPDDIESLVLCIISLRHLFLIFKNSNKEEPDCKAALRRLLQETRRNSHSATGDTLEELDLQ